MRLSMRMLVLRAQHNPSMRAGRTRHSAAAQGDAATAAEEGRSPTSGDGSGALPTCVVIQPDGVSLAVDLVWPVWQPAQPALPQPV